MPQRLSAAHGSCALCCRSREIAPAKGEPQRKAAFIPACAVMQAVPRFAFIALFREFILSNAASARVYVRAGLSLSSSPRGPVVVTFARKNPRDVARARRKILSTESKHACARDTNCRCAYDGRTYLHICKQCKQCKRLVGRLNGSMFSDRL